MSYLLDTNACIAIINGKPPDIRARLRKALDSGAEVFIPSIVAFELWYGVAKSARQEANSRLVETFFAGPVSLLPFEEDDARRAGALRASLESAGHPIGAYDLLIAGQALRHELILITANEREFRRVKDLTWQDWARP
jgi:tRNA(fMet)-specific endonuclease VapC